jgi:ferredoxin-NADP reductase/predicted pyridoxine 5'-phosphate oxidase superfamily flavin-nucleotide-binding protein
MTVSAFHYPSMPYWPNNTPFHKGELLLQEKFGVRQAVESYAPKVIRPFMPDQHREFYSALPFVVIGARDSRGHMWASLLANGGESDFITSPDPSALSINAKPVPGDALQESLQDGDDLGVLGIEFATKRRNRVNGRIRRQPGEANLFELQVEQSFGNCPQYIRPRQWWRKIDSHDQEKIAIRRSNELSDKQMAQIRESDTVFIATGYRGEGESPTFGNDASHRGGPKGWINMQDSKTIILPDFKGNNHYNSLGNIILDNRVGVTVPIFTTGGMIQMTGTATIDYDVERANSLYPGALRLVIFTIDEVVTVPDGSLPLTWKDIVEEQTRKLQVVHKIRQSKDVTSFHLRPLHGDDPELWDFKPGQHLPITLDIGEDKVLMRSYSLSMGPDKFEYRISVKREPFGKASSYLHDHIQEGHVIQVSKPAGDFVLDQQSDRDVVFISAGVGVTPMLSMLHKFAESLKTRKAFWVQGARDGDHHAFRGEVTGIQECFPNDITSHFVYSQAREQDKGQYHSMGRVNPELVAKLVPDLNKADFYMCGPAAFMADMETGLQKLGVDPKYISYETF